MSQVGSFTSDQEDLISSAIETIRLYNRKKADEARHAARSALAASQAAAAKTVLGAFRAAGLSDKTFPGSFDEIRVVTLKAGGAMVLLFDEAPDEDLHDVVL